MPGGGLHTIDFSTFSKEINCGRSVTPELTPSADSTPPNELVRQREDQQGLRLTNEVLTSSASSCSDDSSSVFMSPMSRFDVDSPSHRLSNNKDEEDEPPMTDAERELTAPVQGFLDLMNTTSTRMNELESEIYSVENNRARIVDKWNAQKSDLIESIGLHIIEKARPLFDAYQEQRSIQELCNQAVELFSNAVKECDRLKIASGDGSMEDSELFSLIDAHVTALKNRDMYEQLSLDRTREFNDAQFRCQDLRRSIGMRIIERSWPWYEAFDKCRCENDRLTVLSREMKKELKYLRDEYKYAMSELESISSKVHALRTRDKKL